MCAAPPAPVLHHLLDATPATQDPSRLPLPTAPRLVWQNAQAFNQPLAWDVSSVTSMAYMFKVRSAACLRIACPTPPATQDPSCLPLPTTSSSLAERTCFQPAACLDIFERDQQHGWDVHSAQRRMPPHCLPNATRHARPISPPTSHRVSPRLAVCT